MAHQELGSKMLDRIEADMQEIAEVEQKAKLEGRQMIVILAPRR